MAQYTVDARLTRWARRKGYELPGWYCRPRTMTFQQAQDMVRRLREWSQTPTADLLTITIKEA